MDIKPPQKPPQNNFTAPPDADLRHIIDRNEDKTTLPNPTTTPTLEPSTEPFDPLKGFNPGKDNKEQPTVVKKKKLTKKKKILLITLLLVLIAGIIGFLIFNNKEEVVETSTVVVEEAPEEPPKYYSPLTGKEFASEAPTKRPVTAVMVENSPDARPQSGLEQADMVYEAIAEAGVTRFMAVYQESTPNKIGPVRSARPYYIDYVLGLDASYGHVGGSPEALADIRNLGVKDIDEFSNASTFWRASNRYAPHNAYTSFERLDKANQNKGYTNSEFTPFERKIDVPQTPTAGVISTNVSGANYNSKFIYSPTTNSYARTMAGAPHKDEVTGKQINSKVVIALITNKGLSSDGYHTTYKTVGEGKLLVFQDGIVSEGTWSKPDRKASLVLKDKNGLPMELNVGKTWITLAGSANEVRYSVK